MSDNIKRAVTAIEAEIKNARQGLAHYEKQVNSLQAALNQLGGLSDSAQVANPKGKRGRKPNTVAMEAPSSRKAPVGKGGLPFTGGDFWESLITSRPQAAKDVLAAAIKRAGVKPNSDQVKKLTNRMVFALNDMVKSGKIKDSGKARGRRFFKP